MSCEKAKKWNKKRIKNQTIQFQRQTLMHVSLSDLTKWYQEHREEIVKDFFSFLSFPSISTDPAHMQDCRSAAEWLSSYLERIGFQAVLWETPGLPVVFA